MAVGGRVEWHSSPVRARRTVARHNATPKAVRPGSVQMINEEQTSRAYQHIRRLRACFGRAREERKTRELVERAAKTLDMSGEMG